MKHYRIRPENTACLHCWFVAAMHAYVAAKPVGGTVGIRAGDKGQTTVDMSAVAEAAIGVAVSAIKCIQHQHGAQEAVETALAATEQMMRAAGANFERVDGACGEHQTLQ